MSSSHLVHVEMVDGRILKNISVSMLFPTDNPHEVVAEFYSRKIFEHELTWYPVDKIIAVDYVGEYSG